jgi:hypothetical protein
MELDDLKAAWQRAKEEYPWDEDPKTLLAETKKLEKKRDRDFKRQQMTQILCCVLCLGYMARWYRQEGPLLANAGLILMLLCIALMVAGSIFLRYRLRESHPWLPDEEFLNEERKKVETRIALLRRNALWLFIPAIAGFLTWQIVLSNSAEWTVAIIIIAALASIGSFLFYRRKLRTDLLPMLEDIDRDLEECKTNLPFPWSE